MRSFIGRCRINADIDSVWKMGFGMRFGPFELADILGIDKINRWMENLYDEFGDPQYMASPVIKETCQGKKIWRAYLLGFL